ncbi:MAG: ABC transporter ATP-binding protein [Pseudomonadota bacterium]
MTVIQARGLTKQFGDVRALDGFELQVPRGRIVGLIGPNGSGKTTALKSILGLAQLDQGEIQVLDHHPWRQRAQLMQHVAYIADTGILPKWMRVCDLLDYVAAVHPRFDHALALDRLSRTDISLRKKVRVLSKGMHVQLHLAIVLAIDAELLVLDEPTLGLDVIHRQQFYDAVQNEFFSPQRSVLVTTHEVREIEHILTDVVFIHRGRTRLASSMSELAQQFQKVVCATEAALPQEPLSRRKTPSGHEYIFRGASSQQLEALGPVTVPNLAELFVALVENDAVGGTQ